MCFYQNYFRFSVKLLFDCFPYKTQKKMTAAGNTRYSDVSPSSAGMFSESAPVVQTLGMEPPQSSLAAEHKSVCVGGGEYRPDTPFVLRVRKPWNTEERHAWLLYQYKVNVMKLVLMVHQFGTRGEERARLSVMNVLFGHHCTQQQIPASHTGPGPGFCPPFPPALELQFLVRPHGVSRASEETNQRATPCSVCVAAEADFYSLSSTVCVGGICMLRAFLDTAFHEISSCSAPLTLWKLPAFKI